MTFLNGMLRYELLGSSPALLLVVGNSHFPTAALHPEFSAFFTIIPFPDLLRGRLMFGPSLVLQALRPRLTSVKQAYTLAFG